MHLLEMKQRELEYLTEFELYGPQALPAAFLNKLHVTVKPNLVVGATLEEFGADLDVLEGQSAGLAAGPPSRSKSSSAKNSSAPANGQRLRSITAQYITDIYLHWVSKTREKESEMYLKTLSGE